MTIPETIEHDGRTYKRARWVILQDSEGNTKAESSSYDLLTFYQPGDVILHQYIPINNEEFFDVTDEYLKQYGGIFEEEWGKPVGSQE